MEPQQQLSNYLQSLVRGSASGAIRWSELNSLVYYFDSNTEAGTIRLIIEKRNPMMPGGNVNFGLILNDVYRLQVMENKSQAPILSVDSNLDLSNAPLLKRLYEVAKGQQTQR